MKAFAILINGLDPLTNLTEYFILDIVGVLDVPLGRDAKYI